jgi:hypothetical protein
MPVHAESKEMASLGPRPALRLSATSYGSFDRCSRRWGFTFNEGFEEESGATGLGTRVHSILEEYLTKGTAPDLSETFRKLDYRKLDATGAPTVYTYYPGQIAQAGLSLWPPPGVVQCETYFNVRTQSVTWEGQIDVAYRDTKRHLPVVGDHKTTVDKKWAKTPEVLATDPQGVLYPHALSRGVLYTEENDEPRALPNSIRDSLRGDGTVLNRWVYYLTKLGKYDAWVTEYLSTPQARQPTLDKMDAAGVLMARAYEDWTPALAMEPNPEACNDFGGCPHKNTRCKLTLGEILGIKKGIGNMESFDDFMARQAGGGAPLALPGQAASVVPTRPDYWIPGDPMNDVQGYLHAKGKPEYVIASAADNPPPAEVINAMVSAVNPAAVIPTTSPGVVNPPEAPKFAPSTPMQMPALGSTPSPTVAPALTMPAITMPTLPAAPALAVPALAAPADVDTVQDEYTGKTREELKALAMARGLLDESSKARIENIRSMLRAAPKAAPVPVEGPTRTPQPAVAIVVPAQRPKNLGVYVGCIQLGITMVSLSDFLTPIVAQVQAQTGLPHWNLEDYGKGGARLAGAVEQWLLHHPDYGESIFVDTRSPEAGHVLPILLRYAEITVRSTF